MTDTELRLFMDAKEFAFDAHNGQYRTDGANYFIHPLRVSQRVKTEFQRVVALLHDTVEDTDVTLEKIEKKFGKKVADCVDALSYRKGESYKDYITRVLENPDAIEVKIADICDNFCDRPSQNAIKKGLGGLARLLKFEGEIQINEKKEN